MQQARAGRWHCSVAGTGLFTTRYRDRARRDLVGRPRRASRTDQSTLAPGGLADTGWRLCGWPGVMPTIGSLAMSDRGVPVRWAAPRCWWARARRWSRAVWVDLLDLHGPRPTRCTLNDVPRRPGGRALAWATVVAGCGGGEAIRPRDRRRCWRRQRLEADADARSTRWRLIRRLMLARSSSAEPTGRPSALTPHPPEGPACSGCSTAAEVAERLRRGARAGGPQRRGGGRRVRHAGSAGLVHHDQSTL